jgi:hypothetical protein
VLEFVLSIPKAQAVMQAWQVAGFTGFGR